MGEPYGVTAHKKRGVSGSFILSFIHPSIHPSNYSLIHFVVNSPLLLQAIAFEDVVMKVLTAGGPVANASITPEYVRLHDDKVRDTPLTSNSPPPHPPSPLEPTQPVLAALGLLSLAQDQALHAVVLLFSTAASH